MESIRRTKIVCTLGPAVDSTAAVRDLLHAGMNVARFNFSHGNHEEHRRRIIRLREVSRAEKIPVAVMLDTKGPEIRTGTMRDGIEVDLEADDRITITTDNVPGTAERVSISYARLPQEIRPGGHIYIADGLIDLEVGAVEGTDVHCVVRSGGTLGDRKNVNIPGIRVSLPSMTEQDQRDIAFGVEMEADFVAASFIRTPQDVDAIKQFLRDRESTIQVIAKIEDEQGLANIAEITRSADGIMVARGDLGVQLAVEEIPLAQKRIIATANRLYKPVITATQMLDSMIRNPRPTRAELTDVANAIFDGTDAVMLSGETASGRYPTRSCETLDRIARSVEASEEYRDRCATASEVSDDRNEIGEAMARAAFLVASETAAAAIIAPTLRGNTPRILSHHRPRQPVIAVTTTEAVERQLLLYWGVVPLVSDEVTSSESMIRNAIRNAIDRGYIGASDRVVTIAGMPLTSALPLNTIGMHILGNVLNRGHDGFGGKVTGRVVVAESAADARRRLKLDSTEVLVTPVITKEYLDLLPQILAVVSEERSEVPHADLIAKSEGLVMISEVPDAHRRAEDGMTVTLDGEEKILYEGVL